MIFGLILNLEPVVQSFQEKKFTSDVLPSIIPKYRELKSAKKPSGLTQGDTIAPLL